MKTLTRTDEELGVLSEILDMQRKGFEIQKIMAGDPPPDIAANYERMWTIHEKVKNARPMLETVK
jgi:hypothetical protein